MQALCCLFSLYAFPLLVIIASSGERQLRVLLLFVHRLPASISSPVYSNLDVLGSHYTRPGIMFIYIPSLHSLIALCSLDTLVITGHPNGQSKSTDIFVVDRLQ